MHRRKRRSRQEPLPYFATCPRQHPTGENGGTSRPNHAVTLMSSTKSPRGYSRRNFLTTSMATTMTVTLLDRARGETPLAPDHQPDTRAPATVRLRVNGRDHQLSLDVRTSLLDALREHLGLTGSQEGLRPRPMRRLHGAGRRQARAVLPDARGDGARPRGHDHRGPGAADGSAAPDAAGLHRSRRLPVRLLHARADHVGGRLRPRGPRRQRRGNPRIHERQSLPLRRLSQHRRRRRSRRQAENEGEPDMRPFVLARADSAKQAIERIISPTPSAKARPPSCAQPISSPAARR